MKRSILAIGVVCIFVVLACGKQASKTESNSTQRTVNVLSPKLSSMPTPTSSPIPTPFPTPTPSDYCPPGHGNLGEFCCGPNSAGKNFCLGTLTCGPISLTCG